MMTCEKNQYRGSCAKCGTYIGLLGGCDCEVPVAKEEPVYVMRALRDRLGFHAPGQEYGWVARRGESESRRMPTKEMALADLERGGRPGALRRLVYEGGVTWDDLIPKASPKALRDDPIMTRSPMGWTRDAARAAIDAARNGGYKAIRNWEPAEG